MHAQAVTCYLDSDSDSIVIISLQHDIMFQYKQHYTLYCLLFKYSIRESTYDVSNKPLDSIQSSPSPKPENNPYNYMG